MFGIPNRYAVRLVGVLLCEIQGDWAVAGGNMTIDGEEPKEELKALERLPKR